MQIKKVIGECLVKMGEEDFASKQSITPEQSELRDKLLKALNVAYREIVTVYLPLYYEQPVTFSGGKCLASTLDKKIIYPVRVETADGKKTFRTTQNAIIADIEGEATITYAYMPDEITIGVEINDMRLTQSALADGTLAEYYYQNKLFELARDFDTDFRAQMGILKYRGRNITVKARRWQA